MVVDERSCGELGDDPVDHLDTLRFVQFPEKARARLRDNQLYSCYLDKLLLWRIWVWRGSMVVFDIKNHCFFCEKLDFVADRGIGDIAYRSLQTRNRNSIEKKKITAIRCMNAQGGDCD